MKSQRTETPEEKAQRLLSLGIKTQDDLTRFIEDKMKHIHKLYNARNVLRSPRDEVFKM